MKTLHPHAEILKAFADDTSVKIERQEKSDSNWYQSSISTLINYPEKKFRLKPAMRSITLANGTVVEWPEPMRVAPEYEQFFIAGYEMVVESNWNDSAWQQQVLKAGFCHLTEEAAQQHRKALVLANGGEL